MSTSLYWEPVESKAKHFGDALKFCLRRRLEETWADCILGEQDLEWLRGVRDAASNTGPLVKDVDFVIAMIAKHGQIRVFEKG